MLLDFITRSAISDTAPIRERLERTKAFLDYLDLAVTEINDESIVTFWKEQSAEARKGFLEIEQRI